LHLTFDNTTSDCKNSQFFTYLACLVAAGVFEEITISNLLVGHTHDIVDQMFGCWAQALKIQRAPSLTKFHALCRAMYNSNIYAVGSWTPDEVPEPVRQAASSYGLVDEPMALASQASHASQGRASNASKGSKASNGSKASTRSKKRVIPEDPDNPRVADRLVELSECLGVSPVMSHQTSTVDGENWKMINIPALSQGHNFFITKKPIYSESDGLICDHKVVLFSKYLVDSVQNDKTVEHKHPLEKHGGWTECMTLIESVSKELSTQDPSWKFLKQVETGPIRRCILSHVLTTMDMDAEESTEMLELLKRFDDAFKEQERGCEVCHKHSKQISDIGPISSITDQMSEQQITEIHQKTNLRKTIKQAQKEHMENEQHRAAVGWWTKWLRRVATTIRPYFLARGLVIDAERLEDELDQDEDHVHPSKLPADKGSAPFAAQRVDLEWVKEHGEPQEGDMIVLRGRGKAQEPFWLGKIQTIYHAKEEYAPAAAVEKGTSAKAGPAQVQKSHKGIFADLSS
jgi:hypothetical protein